MSVHRFWIPVPDGARECMCCGVCYGGITLPCGCHYCGICEGRGHDEDHGLPDGDECTKGAASPIFRRADNDCVGCGLRHDDWETCARLIHEFAKEHQSESFTSDFEVVDGVARFAGATP